MNALPRQQRLAGFDDDEFARGEGFSGGEAEPSDTAAGSAQAETAAQAADGAAELVRDKTVYVVDAHSLIYQVFHARGDMSGPAGQPVGAIHGFLMDILLVLERRKPDFLLCAFDAPGKTFRHDLYAQYKIHRPSMPDDLRAQITHIQRFLQSLAIPVLALAGYEADDVLATVADQVQRHGGQCYLVTSDKDCRQLISDRVHLYNLRKDEVVDTAAVVSEWGIRPDQVVDLQALWGDSTDNVPGVAGIGQKTATQLLTQYETLEGIYAHLDEVVREKQRENLREGREAAFLSRQLVRLSRSVPVHVPWHAAHVGGIDREAVVALCQEFGFRNVGQRLVGLAVGEAPAEWRAHYETVATPEALRDVVQSVRRERRVSVDVETTSQHARWAEIVGFSFAWKPGHAVYVPVRAPAGEPRLDPGPTLSALREVLEDESIRKVGQNLKYDRIVLRGAGVLLRGVDFDTMVADYLLAPGERNHSMDDLAKRYLNHDTIRIKELIGAGKAQKRMDEVPVELVTSYAAEDADVPLRLSGILARRLREERLDELFRTLEMPLIEVLAELEYNGITIDVPLLRRLSGEYEERLLGLQQEIHALAGTPFNIDSPKQLAHILFTQMGLPVVKKTKTGASTDASVLSELALKHPLPARIIEYRQLAKLKNTYVDALPELVHPVTGRVHTSFKQDVAATGRLSSTEPNLQNIPVRSRQGREIRAAFVPGAPGWKLLCADYSQIELRVLAHFSQDQALLAAFAQDRDIHAQVASEIHAVPLSDVTADMRRAAKAINFGVIYGQSPFGLAKSLGIEKSEAAAFIDAYFGRYPGVEAFMERILAECHRNGYVSTALGRRRAIQGARDPASHEPSRQRNLPERIAINTVIQGTAADLIKQAMIQVHQRLQQEQLQAKMLLQIHDELVFEAPEQELDRLAELVVAEMSTVGAMSVPLKVDVKSGDNWAECEPFGGPPPSA